MSSATKEGIHSCLLHFNGRVCRQAERNAGRIEGKTTASFEAHQSDLIASIKTFLITTTNCNLVNI